MTLLIDVTQTLHKPALNRPQEDNVAAPFVRVAEDLWRLSAEGEIWRRQAIRFVKHDAVVLTQLRHELPMDKIRAYMRLIFYAPAPQSCLASAGKGKVKPKGDKGELRTCSAQGPRWQQIQSR